MGVGKEVEEIEIIKSNTFPKDSNTYCTDCKYENQSVHDEPCCDCALTDDICPTCYMPAHDEVDKNKADSGKAQLSLVPRRIIWDIAKVRMYGVNVKYPETGRDGWRNIDKERLQDAMFRHMLRYLDDPDGVDEESGLPHLWHVATNCAFLCELEGGDNE